MRGVVIRWNERGFGFIKPDDGSEDLFCGGRQGKAQGVSAATREGLWVLVQRSARHWAVGPGLSLADESVRVAISSHVAGSHSFTVPSEEPETRVCAGVKHSSLMRSVCSFANSTTGFSVSWSSSAMAFALFATASLAWRCAIASTTSSLPAKRCDASTKHGMIQLYWDLHCRLHGSRY